MQTLKCEYQKPHLFWNNESQVSNLAQGHVETYISYTISTNYFLTTTDKCRDGIWSHCIFLPRHLQYIISYQPIIRCYINRITESVMTQSTKQLSNQPS